MESCRGGHAVDFQVPKARDGWQWRRLIDTSLQYEPQWNFWQEGTGDIVVGGQALPAWSVAVWHETQKDAPGTQS